MLKPNCARSMLCPCSFGVALGTAKGLFLLVLAWAGYFWHFQTSMIHHVATFYHGYAATIVGGFYGAFWGFLEGFIFGVIVGLVYNFCICNCAKTTMCESKDMKK